MTTNRELGVCTWTFGHLPLADIAQRLATLGYDGVELMGNLQAYRADEAAQVLRDYNLQVFSITPNNVDLAHPDDARRTEAIDYYLRLLDFAAALGDPLVSCHGYVGRIQAISTVAEEKTLFAQAVRQIAGRAGELGLRMVIEVLNRYESFLINTAAEAVDFIANAGADNVGILLDAYHMNIEEANPAAAIRHAGNRLWLYHVADSNRQGVGRGHTDFAGQLSALSDIAYDGPIIIECTAPGPNPFIAIKSEDSIEWLETYLQESQSWLHQY